MNFEIIENLNILAETINLFLEFSDEYISEINNEELEYEFLEDENGISNTELDNIIEHLEQVIKIIDRIK
jgi:hypothetical protein